MSEPKRFSETLAEMRGGEVERVLTQALADVCSSVSALGKKGAVTLTLRVEPNGDGAVTILPDVNHRVPKAPIGASVFFVDDAGGLHRSDPRQVELKMPEGITYIGKERASGGGK